VDVQRGVVRAYDSANHQADVLVYGSMSRVILGVPVSDSIAPELMAVGANCGLVVFSPGDTGVVVCTFGATAVPPFGPRLGVMDLVGAWRDGFWGDSLHSQYATRIDVGGTVGLMDAAHGGEIRLRVGNADARETHLVLGSVAGGFDTLNASSGWVMLARFKVVPLTSVIHWMGACSQPGLTTDRIMVGLYNGSAYWMMRVTASGSSSNVYSTVVADSEWHLHALDVTSERVKYFVDGELVATCTENIPTGVVITPTIRCRNYSAAYKYFYMGEWWVIPRGLV